MPSSRPRQPEQRSVTVRHLYDGGAPFGQGGAVKGAVGQDRLQRHDRVEAIDMGVMP